MLLQALLAILDSPLAKAGKLKVITGDQGGYGPKCTHRWRHLPCSRCNLMSTLYEQTKPVSCYITSSAPCTCSKQKCYSSRICSTGPMHLSTSKALPASL